jgi:hypothetical protein
MNSIYKYGFYFFIICSLVFFNVWNISRIQLDDKEKIENDKTERRLKSLQKSNIILNRKVPEIYGYDVVTDEKNKIISKDSTYLIALLSDFDCSKCQENELKNLHNFKKNFIDYRINILCLTRQETINRILAQMRGMNIYIPLFIISDDDFTRLSFDIDYPQIVLINQGIIVSAFSPVKLDYDFSTYYYDELIKNLAAE